MKATVLLLALVLTACAAPAEPPKPTPTPTPAFQDHHLRPVRMTSGRALTYVHPETAAQILCQLVDWARLLDSRVGREPLDYPYAGCVITTDQGRLTVQMRESEDAFEATTTIAGRPAIEYDRLNKQFVYIVALTDEALQPALARHRTLRTLEVEAMGENPETEREVAMAVLAKIVPMLAKDGDPLPDIDEDGNVPYVSTPLTENEQFIDLPLPAQALQLCTVLLSVLAAQEVVASDSGSCTLSTDQGKVTVETEHSILSLDDYLDTVAGRPAAIRPQAMTIRLRDDARTVLDVSAPDPRAVAEKLVPLLS